MNKGETREKERRSNMARKRTTDPREESRQIKNKEQHARRNQNKENRKEQTKDERGKETSKIKEKEMNEKVGMKDGNKDKDRKGERKDTRIKANRENESMLGVIRKEEGSRVGKIQK